MTSAHSNPFVLPLSNLSDVTAILYLNPELPAYSNIVIPEDAIKDFHKYDTLPNSVPEFPLGFNSKVFIATQSNVSTLNRYIRDAMIVGEGMSLEVLDRKGTFVGTIMHGLNVFNHENVSSSNNISFEISNRSDTYYPLSSNVMQIGDHVRIGCKPKYNNAGNVTYIDSEVIDISYENQSFSVRTPVNQFILSKINAADRHIFELFGIKIYDPIRQARIAYARSSSSINKPNPNSPDVVPTNQFAHDMYQLIYPETRGYTPSDTYLDYRNKWNRATEYRIRDGSDIYNINAPYMLSNNFLSEHDSNTYSSGSNQSTNSLLVKNILIAGLPDGLVASPSNTTLGNKYVQITSSSFKAGFVNGGNFYATMSNASLCSNLIVTPTLIRGTSPLEIDHTILVRNGGAIITSNIASFGFGNLSVQSSNAVTIQSHLNVAKTLGVGTSNPDSSSAFKMAVGGDIFVSGTVTTLSDLKTKEDLLKINDPLNKLCSLNGYTYNTKSCDSIQQSNRRHIGLIAQEVMEVVPEAIYQAPNGYKSVAYGNLSGLVVEAMKELVARVELIELRLLNMNMLANKDDG